ncbi:uncharacterized protein LOC105842410 [Bombyx mori]|uniref:Endonuclease-reverse transcriptase n=1 Tax=Bombyx mori TaxID=7091 RepID=A0A8R2C913_BOMMO|nr:uncharacterized protein LOC105842410 [Bombyx mori]
MPLKDEVRAAINHLKRKAVGFDEIPIETIKAMGEIGVDILHIICCRIWITGVWPSDWSHSIFIPLHKKGSTKKCNNYRLISLVSHASKVMLHIINTRHKVTCPERSPPSKQAFDTVKWWKLWLVLTEMGVPQHLVHTIRRLYEDGTAAVRVDGIDSERFST